LFPVQELELDPYDLTTGYNAQAGSHGLLVNVKTATPSI
jgi:hypothetical protein